MTNARGTKHIVLALTEVWRSTGGIPAFNKALCSAAAQLSSDVRVVSLNDDSAPGPINRDVEITVSDRNKLLFTTALVKYTPIRSPSLVVIGHVNLAPLGLLLRAIKPFSRYVVVAHGVEAWGPKGWLVRLALRMADRIVAVSRYTGRQLVHSNGVRPRKVFVLRNVVPSHLIDQSRARRDPSEDTRPPDVLKHDGRGPVILTTGRLDAREQYKGHDRVIQSLPLILSRYPGAQYVVVGDGDDRDRLEALAHRLGVSSRVRFEGYVDDGDLGTYYQEADVFVMPSTGEGFGIAFLEAMLYGKPVVAGNCDGSGEAVVHGETGFLVNPRDIQEIADAVLQLWEDEAARERLGANGRIRVLEEFTFHRFKDDLERLLTGLSG